MRLRIAVLLVGVLACSHPRRGEIDWKAARPPLAMSVDQIGVATAAISGVIASLPDSTTVCVTLAGPPRAYWYSPNADLLTQIDRRSRRVVGPADCPPTYQNMVVLVDSAGHRLDRVRPPGYIDPYDLILPETLVVRPDSNVVRVDLHQGTRSTYYQCVARRSEAATWVAACRVTGRAISARPPDETLHLTDADLKEVVVGTALAPLVTVRAGREVVGFCISLLADGDTEVVLSIDDARRARAALDAAIAHADAAS